MKVPANAMWFYFKAAADILHRRCVVPGVREAAFRLCRHRRLAAHAHRPPGQRRLRRPRRHRRERRPRITYGRGRSNNAVEWQDNLPRLEVDRFTKYAIRDLHISQIRSGIPDLECSPDPTWKRCWKSGFLESGLFQSVNGCDSKNEDLHYTNIGGILYQPKNTVLLLWYAYLLLQFASLFQWTLNKLPGNWCCDYFSLTS